MTRIDVSSVTMDRLRQLYTGAAARLSLATKGLTVGERIELTDETTGRTRAAMVTELTGDHWVWVVWGPGRGGRWTVLDAREENVR